MVRKIIHIDMDCFFAAVEMRDYPEYKNVPMAIGGSVERRGVISTCNYPARKFGVRSALPTAKALQLCPQLVLLPGRMALYKEVSQQIRAIFARYTSIIEPISLDEAYLDVTDCQLHQGSATYIANAIRQDIERELQLTASAGVAPIKFLAKIASDINKPNGIYVVTPQTMEAVIESLPLEKIPGVGKVSIERLHQAGLYTCKDIKQSNRRQLLAQFGRLGESLWQRSHGIDNREVVVERERKSVGVEHTLAKNIESYDECWQLIEHRLFPELEQRLARASDSQAITKQGIKLKFADFQQTTIESSTPNLTLEAFVPLLQQVLTRQQGRPIRLLGLSVGLKPEDPVEQLALL